VRAIRLNFISEVEYFWMRVWIAVRATVSHGWSVSVTVSDDDDVDIGVYVPTEIGPGCSPSSS
jgi:hypothetical protein